MALKLKGSTSGFTAIDAPAVAGDNTLVLPANNGSASQYLQTNGSGVLSWATVTVPDPNNQRTVLSETDISGASTFLMTGIDTDASVIQVFFHSFYNSTGTAFHFRLGTGGAADGSNNYYSYDALVGTSTGGGFDQSIIDFSGAGSNSSQTYHGLLTVSRFGTSNRYHFNALTSHTNSPTYFWHTQGIWNGSGPLNCIQWIVAGGTGTIGTTSRAQVVYYK